MQISGDYLQESYIFTIESPLICTKVQSPIGCVSPSFIIFTSIVIHIHLHFVLDPDGSVSPFFKSMRTKHFKNIVVKYQINKKVLSIQCKPFLACYKRKSSSKFQKEMLKMINQCLFIIYTHQDTIMWPAQFRTQCVSNWKSAIKLPHLTKIRFIKTFSELCGQLLRKIFQ